MFLDQFERFSLEVLVPLCLGSLFPLGPWLLLITDELFRVELSSLENSGLSAALTGDLS